MIERFSGAAAEWDGFVRRQAGWTHFHLHDWKPLIEQVFGHECVYLAARGPDAELTGVLPLVRVRSLVFGHYLVSMPFLNYGGPLGDPGAVRALAQHAAEGAGRDGADLLELRCRSQCNVDLPVSHRKVTVVLDLPRGDVAPMWSSLGSKLRSQIKRPQKEGVTVRFGSEQVEPFYGVFARHMHDLGTPVLAQSLFEALAARFPRDVWFGCAYLGDRAVAAGCGFRWGAEFEMTWASSLRQYNPIAPNMALYWSFMERCVAEGVSVFNFGRCTPGGGTHRFKRQWGGRDEPLWWYQRSRGASGTPSPDDARFRWGPAIWRRLPLSLATVLGPRIVRSIP